MVERAVMKLKLGAQSYRKSRECIRMMFGGWKSNRLKTRRDKDTPNRIYVTGPSESETPRPKSTSMFTCSHVRMHFTHSRRCAITSLT